MNVLGLVVAALLVSLSIMSLGNSLGKGMIHIRHGMVTSSKNMKSGIIIGSAGYGFFSWVPFVAKWMTGLRTGG